MRIKHEKDFWSGVMFIACGLFFALFAQKYDFGTAQRMGPAYLPTVLGAILALIGGIDVTKRKEVRRSGARLVSDHCGEAIDLAEHCLVSA